MRQKKKHPFIAGVLCFIVIVFTCIAIAGVLGEASDPDDSQSSHPAESTNPSLSSESILIDDSTIKATFIGAQDQSSLGVFYVTLKIENKTDTEVVINLEDADVDGETIPIITTGVPLVIRPGNSGQTGFIFSMVNLSISTMDEAEEATFRIVARNNETFDTIYESELITVTLPKQ